MAKPRLKMIMNPNADMGNAWKFAADLRHLVEAFADVQWSGTVYPTHAKELAVQAGDEGYDIVVAMGGDGTAHEVVNGLMEIPADKRPKFAIIPLGSGNDYAANLGISKEAAEAINTIRDGYSKKVDLFLIEDEDGRQEYVDNTANIGFGGSVTIFSHTIPLLRGFVMYLVAVLQTIFSNFTIHKVEIKTDEKEWEDEVLMIALNNGPREGRRVYYRPRCSPRRWDSELLHRPKGHPPDDAPLAARIYEGLPGTLQTGVYGHFQADGDQIRCAAGAAHRW